MNVDTKKHRIVWRLICSATVILLVFLLPLPVLANQEPSYRLYCWCEERPERFYWLLSAARKGDMVYNTVMRELFSFDEYGRLSLVDADTDAETFVRVNQRSLDILHLPTNNEKYEYQLCSVKSACEVAPYLAFRVNIYRASGKEKIGCVEISTHMVYREYYNNEEYSAEVLPMKDGFSVTFFKDASLFAGIVTAEDGNQFEVSVVDAAEGADNAVLREFLANTDWMPCLAYMEEEYRPLEEAFRMEELYRKRAEERFAIEEKLKIDIVVQEHENEALNNALEEWHREEGHVKAEKELLQQEQVSLENSRGYWEQVCTIALGISALLLLFLVIFGGRQVALVRKNERNKSQKEENQ